jgi:hypothetical protein
MPSERTPEPPTALEHAARSEPAPPEAVPRSLSEIRSLRPRPPRPIVLWVAIAAAVMLVVGGWISTYLSK